MLADGSKAQERLPALLVHFLQQPEGALLVTVPQKAHEAIHVMNFMPHHRRHVPPVHILIQVKRCPSQGIALSARNVLHHMSTAAADLLLPGLLISIREWLSDVVVAEVPESIDIQSTALVRIVPSTAGAQVRIGAYATGPN